MKIELHQKKQTVSWCRRLLLSPCFGLLPLILPNEAVFGRMDLGGFHSPPLLGLTRRVGGRAESAAPGGLEAWCLDPTLGEPAKGEERGLL